MLLSYVYLHTRTGMGLLKTGIIFYCGREVRTGWATVRLILGAYIDWRGCIGQPFCFL